MSGSRNDGKTRGSGSTGSGSSGPDPLMESLMQLAAGAAPFIRRAREAGMFKSDGFRARGDTVNAAAQPAEQAPPQPATDRSALEGIIVRQALRIQELEAELATLRAKPAQASPKRAAKAAAKPAAKPAPKTGRKSAK